MTQEEIINIAIELGSVFMDEDANAYIFLEDLPEIVAVAIASEREACITREECAAVIRTRGKA